MATPKALLPQTLSNALTKTRPPRRLALRQQSIRHLSTTSPRSAATNAATRASVRPKKKVFFMEKASTASKYRCPPGANKPRPPDLSEPAFSAISYIPPPSNDPDGRALPSPVPHQDSLRQAGTIFTSQCPRFLYSAARFLNIPLNTHTPEICFLGRSNVGKSTLINALAGVDANMARKAHGLKARGMGLAITSQFAGSTKCMNAYGFGPPSKAQRLAALARAKDVKKGMDTAVSRAERRAASHSKEAPPQHRLIMVDMPGYGLNSEALWGLEIGKYLAKRQVLKGAVLLIDAVAGVMAADRLVLEMLRDAEVRTAVVLTKVDKLSRERQEGRAQSRVDQVCKEVWDELREVEKGGMTWLEGSEKGWQNEIWVTSAGDPTANGDGVGVTGARWSICRMAGLVEDSRVLKNSSPEHKRLWAPKIVSFDELQRVAASAERKPRTKSLKASF